MGTDVGQAAFLFTDVEGSTRLWEDHPGEMSTVLADHDRILLAAIERHGGRVFSKAGDSFAAVFAAGPEGIAAAVESQLALRRLGVGGEIVGVRMAVHVGEAERRGDDYFGQALNRCARLMAVGHGGQILVSQAAAESYQRSDPGDIALLGMGEHRLKDLSRSEQIFQVTHPDLPWDFPPLRSLDLHSHNLPIQVTTFIGRKKELARVRELLDATRLLTLTGVGGTGKTRLALQTTAETLGGYPDGAWLVELGPVSDPDLLPQVTAAVLKMRPHPGRPMLDTLVDGLESQKLLLVLDNCEHVIESAASLIDTIMRACPGVKVLATSREALGVSGEVAYRVPSLSLPDEAEDILNSESGRLFSERAAAAMPGFAITASIAPAVSRICRRLDGIPLAVELAAARVRALSPNQIAAQLEQSFRILTGGNRAALPRQQTLEASIRWSYDLLTPDEQDLLRHLSVFSGGFTLQGAEAIQEGDAVETLLNLVDKSLVIPEETDAEVRYRLLETIRTFATERLVETGESEAIRRRHAEFYLDLAKRAEPHIHGPDQKQWLDRLDVEHDNLRGALEWSIDIELLTITVPMTAALVDFWLRRGHWTGACRWIDRLLSRGGDLEDPTLALLMSEAAALFGTQGDFERVKDLATRGLELSRRTADQQQIAWATFRLGDNLSEWWDDRDRALPLIEEGLAGVRQAGNRWREAKALFALGSTLSRAGDLERAVPLLAEALAMFEAQGDHWQAAVVMSFRAWVLRRLGQFEEAAQLAEESVRVFRSFEAEVWAAHSLYALGQMLTHLGQYARAGEVLAEAVVTLHKAGDLGCRGHVLGIQAFLAIRQGELDRARKLLEESLQLLRDKRDPFTTAQSLDYLARVVAKSGSPDTAARLLGASQGLRKAPTAPADQAEYDELINGLRAGLGDAGLNRAFADGETMSIENAIAYGLRVCEQKRMTGNWQSIPATLPG